MKPYPVELVARMLLEFARGVVERASLEMKREAKREPDDLPPNGFKLRIGSASCHCGDAIGLPRRAVVEHRSCSPLKLGHTFGSGSTCRGG